MSETMVANERQQQAVDNHIVHAPPPGVSALPPAPSPPGQAGQAPGPVVIHGTCGWSSTPFPARGAADKLRHYSRHFGCVEVDTSTYAIPRPDVTQRWAQAVAEGFQFHVKAFGLFCAQGCQVSSLPAEVRALLPPAQQAGQHVRLEGAPPGLEGGCWRLFHEALEPLYRSGKLGAVVFQFHLSFQPSRQNLEYILRCRSRLDPRFRMAVELRCRRWLTEPAWRRQLSEALSAAGVCLVSADELEHETAQPDRQQRGLPPGAVRRVLPISLEVTTPDWHYVRVHRRHGTTDRLLPPAEIAGWAERLAGVLAPRLRGPIAFLWGTDWEDACLVNARNLDAALPPAMRLDWRQRCRAAPPKPGTLRSLLAARAAAASPPDEGSAEAQQAAHSGNSASERPASLGSGSRASGSSNGQKRGRQGEGGEGAAVAGPRARGGGILRFLQRSPAAAASPACTAAASSQ